MRNDDYKKQIAKLNHEANDIRKYAKAHVKTVMSGLLKYVRDIEKKSDAIAIKAEQLLNKRLEETYDNPKYDKGDEIANRLDDIQLIDIASEIFGTIYKTIENSSDKYCLN